MAQLPQKFSYQAVVRNASGVPVSNGTNVAFRISIIDNIVNGVVLYSERHLVILNNSLGIVNLEIGSGTLLNGAWPNVQQWSNNLKFVKVEIDITGNSSYTDMGTTQLLSVPFALHSQSANQLNPSAKINLNQINNSNANVGQTIKWNGTEWVAADDNDTLKDDWGKQYVNTNSTLIGKGTSTDLLGIAQQGATNGQVLKWNGTTWAPANDNNTPDNWGSQVVQSNTTIAGNGTATNQLRIAQQGAINGQVLKWNGTTWTPNGDSGVLMNGVGNQHYLPKFTNTGRLTNSKVYDNGTTVFINQPKSNVPLSITGDTSNFNIQFYEGNNYRGYVGSNTGNNKDIDLGSGSGTNGSVHLSPNSSPVLTASSAGKVGIGNVSPLYHLDIKSNDATQVHLATTNNATSSNLILKNDVNNVFEMSKYSSLATGNISGISKANLATINSSSNGSLLINAIDSFFVATNNKARIKIQKSGSMSFNSSNVNPSPYNYTFYSPDTLSNIMTVLTSNARKLTGYSALTTTGDLSFLKIGNSFSSSSFANLPYNNLGMIENETGSLLISTTDSMVLKTSASTAIKIRQNGQVVFGNSSISSNDIYKKIYVKANNSDSIAGYFTNQSLNNVITFNSNLSIGSSAVKGVSLSAANRDGVGVHGVSINSSGNGVGGLFDGGYFGLIGRGRLNGYTGIYAYANSATIAFRADGTTILNGNLQGTGTNTYSSDAKLKSNIRPIQYGLNDLLKLNPKSYEFKVGEFGDMYLPSGLHHGLIAQDLQFVMPELVIKSKHTDLTKERNSPESQIDYLTVNYMELIPVLINAIKEQQAQIEQLKSQIGLINK